MRSTAGEAPRADAGLGRPNLVLAGRFEPAEARRYRHVPFEVPSGVRQLHLRYAYSERIDSDPLAVGGSTLDLGLFDERGTAAGGNGFRGWSGSNRLEVTIDERWATPPYRPGGIGAGTWHVLLGPYKVAPGGCDWLVEVWFDAGLSPADEAAAEARPPAVLPARSSAAAPARAGWLRGDLHCHSLYSDGDSWPREVLGAAAQAGLEFLGVTDHNNVAHHPAYREAAHGLRAASVGRAAALDGAGRAPALLPGVEVTTYGGHWNAWGTDRWWDFRDPSSDAVGRVVREAAAAGAVVSVNHPKPFGPEWEYDVGGFHAVEVWNGPWVRLNAIALAWWEELLRRGERVAAVGGSDTHYLRRRDDPRHSVMLGAPTTWLHAPVGDTAALLGALRQGRAFVSASPRGPQLYLDASETGLRAEVRGAKGETLLVLDQRGVTAAHAVSADPWDVDLRVPAGARYLRAQLVAHDGNVLAIANPVWAERL